MKWYLPSFGGDFRLVEDADAAGCRLELVRPTPHERQLLNAFMVKACKKGWANITDVGDVDRTFVLNGPMAKIAPLLVKATRPRDRTITAVTFAGGRVEVAEGAESRELADLAQRAAPEPPKPPYRGAATPTQTEPVSKEKAKAAATVARPTPSCPDCGPGAIEPATEVLLEFLTPRQHRDWADHRAILVEGGTTGHHYLLAHRHSDQAARQGRICLDVDDHAVVHFHDWTVPPEEEVLAAKLILEHREAWLRNEATLWDAPDGTFKFKNPFGDRLDGVPDAQFSENIGKLFLRGLGRRA